MNIAVVGVGSNICPRENIQKAKKILLRGHVILAESRFVKTKPIGSAFQDDFLNGAYLVETSLGYEDFKTYLKQAEEQMGRRKTLDKFAPRTIDLDVIVWNKEIVHQDFFERDFVRTAVSELLPDIGS